MHSELGYFAHSLISGLNDDTVTLNSLRAGAEYMTLQYM